MSKDENSSFMKTLTFVMAFFSIGGLIGHEAGYYNGAKERPYKVEIHKYILEDGTVQEVETLKGKLKDLLEKNPPGTFIVIFEDSLRTPTFQTWVKSLTYDEKPEKE